MLAEDETGRLLFPPLRSCGTLRGQAAEVRLSGRNARRVVFGAMNLRTGYRLSSVRKNQRAEDFRHLLRLIHGGYWGWHVARLLDEDPSHAAGGSLELAGELGIEPLWLPKRCPKLNPRDHLWGHAKEEVCGNRPYGSIDEQVDRFLGHLYGLSPEDALRKAGVHSEEFWLRSVL